MRRSSRRTIPRYASADEGGLRLSETRKTKKADRCGERDKRAGKRAKTKGDARETEKRKEASPERTPKEREMGMYWVGSSRL
ncbi:unnamed protein product [Victoria cruziana]